MVENVIRTPRLAPGGYSTKQGVSYYETKYAVKTRMQAKTTTLAVAICLACSCAGQACAYGLKVVSNIKQTHDCLHAAAKKYGHRPELVFGIAAQESRFNPQAVSYIKGKPIAYGVMQVYYDVHKPVLEKRGISRHDLFNPCVGADEGARILREFMSVHGNSWKAVGAYYAGNRYQNEKDRRWYANSVAKHVAWFDHYGTASVLSARYRANASSEGKTNRYALLADASVSIPLPNHSMPVSEVLKVSTVAWEAR